jgi:hypothetical protein
MESIPAMLRDEMPCPGLFAALSSTALAQSDAPPDVPSDWPVTSAPARFTIEPDRADPQPPVSWISLNLPDPRWVNMTVRVFTDTGLAVGSDLLWSAPGEPATFLFDSSSGAKRYNVYVGSNWPVMHLPDTNVGVWLETREGDGRTISHLPDMLATWKQSHHVLGRAILTGIDEGGNRFGPQGNLLLHMQGFFDAPAPEHLDLAVVSTDSSFVQVDGKEVVEWPGRHGWGYDGMKGPPQGGIDVAPGRHILDYYNAYVGTEDGNLPLMACLAVKGGAFPDFTLLTPTSDFFRPVFRDHIVDYELQTNASAASAPQTAPPLAIDWSTEEQSMISTDLPDIGFVALQLTCLNLASTFTTTWTFDDASTADGQSVKHVFPRSGMRTIHLEQKDGDKVVASLTQTVYVHPDWPNAYKEPDLIPAQEAEMASRDPATLSASDLASCCAMFGFYQQLDALLKFLPAVVTKMKEVQDTDLPRLKDAALYLVRDDWSHATEEIQILKALIDRASAVTPATPESAAVGSQSRLALARLTLKTSDHVDEVRSLIDAINVTSLPGEEPRGLKILKADLALAAGDVAGAKKQYESLTGAPDGPDERSSIRRTARIGQARAFLDRKDFDSAEDTLNEVVWQSPVDKLASDWALTRLRLYQEENLPVAAYLWAKRLLPVITEEGRSELLFRLTDLAFAQGDNDLANKTLLELLKKHPYSQEAAQVKEKWPSHP